MLMNLDSSIKVFGSLNRPISCLLTSSMWLPCSVSCLPSLTNCRSNLTRSISLCTTAVTIAARSSSFRVGRADAAADGREVGHCLAANLLARSAGGEVSDIEPVQISAQLSSRLSPLSLLIMLQ